MVTTYNGMLAAELGDVCWQKSWHSNPNGECVELAALSTGEIAMRNSRFPAGPVLLYTRQRSPHSWQEPRMGLLTIYSAKRVNLLASSNTGGRRAATQR